MSKPDFVDEILVDRPVVAELLRLRAEVKDLRARLKAARWQCAGRPEEFTKEVLRYTDLRCKNWEDAP